MKSKLFKFIFAPAILADRFQNKPMRFFLAILTIPWFIYLGIPIFVITLSTFLIVEFFINLFSTNKQEVCPCKAETTHSI